MGPPPDFAGSARWQALATLSLRHQIGLWNESLNAPISFAYVIRVVRLTKCLAVGLPKTPDISLKLLPPSAYLMARGRAFQFPYMHSIEFEG